MVQETTGDIAGSIRRAKGYDRAAFAEIYRFAGAPADPDRCARPHVLPEWRICLTPPPASTIMGLKVIMSYPLRGLST